MTPEQVKNVIKIIKAFYPTIKLLDVPENEEVEVGIWVTELSSCDNDIMLYAVKGLCEHSESALDINLPHLLREYKYYETKEKEKTKRLKEKEVVKPTDEEMKNIHRLLVEKGLVKN